MKKELHTEIEINTSLEQVWQVLTDFESFPKWNPFIKSIKGEQEKGKNIEIEVMPPGRKSMTFNPVILTFEPNQELRWLGSGPIKGLFDGEHYFVISATDRGTVKFEHGEKFSGILIGFMGKLLDDTKVGFEQMNDALKIECEQRK